MCIRYHMLWFFTLLVILKSYRNLIVEAYAALVALCEFAPSPMSYEKPFGSLECETRPPHFFQPTKQHH